MIDIHRPSSSRSGWLRVVTLSLVLGIWLVGCGQPDRPLAPAPIVIAQALTPTATASPVVEPTMTMSPAMQTQAAAIYANETAEAEFDATSAALPTPLPDDGLPIPTSEPTPTIAVGYGDCNLDLRDELFDSWSCWQTV